MIKEWCLPAGTTVWDTGSGQLRSWQAWPGWVGILDLYQLSLPFKVSQFGHVLTGPEIPLIGRYKIHPKGIVIPSTRSSPKADTPIAITKGIIFDISDDGLHLVLDFEPTTIPQEVHALTATPLTPRIEHRWQPIFAQWPQHLTNFKRIVGKWKP